MITFRLEQVRSMADGEAPKGLFDRIPADLLRPLTGSGRSAMWELLVYLNDTLFSVDTIGGNGDGYRRHHIVDEIENFLMNRADWSGGEEDAADADRKSTRLNYSH